METKYKPLVDCLKTQINNSSSFLINPVVVLGSTESGNLLTLNSTQFSDPEHFRTSIKIEAFTYGADFAAIIGCGMLLKTPDGKDGDQYLKDVEKFMERTGGDLMSHPDAEEVLFIHYETIEGKAFAEVAPIISGQIGEWEEIPMEQTVESGVLDNLLEIRRNPKLAPVYTALLEKQEANPTLH